MRGRHLVLGLVPEWYVCWMYQRTNVPLPLPLCRPVPCMEGHCGRTEPYLRAVETCWVRILCLDLTVAGASCKSFDSVLCHQVVVEFFLFIYRHLYLFALLLFILFYYFLFAGRLSAGPSTVGHLYRHPACLLQQTCSKYTICMQHDMIISYLHCLVNSLSLFY